LKIFENIFLAPRPDPSLQQSPVGNGFQLCTATPVIITRPMTEASYRAQLVHYIREQARPQDKFSHQARLYRLAVSLAEGRPFDDDVVFAASWIHDLGVFIGHRPEEPEALSRWDHLSYVMEKAPEILMKMGFPPQKIPAVLEAVRTHMPNSTPASFEGNLLRDADILELLGAVGILRTASKVGRDTRFPEFRDALAALCANARELPSKLQLDSSRREVGPRLKILNDFIEAAEREAAGMKW